MVRTVATAQLLKLWSRRDVERSISVKYRQIFQLVARMPITDIGPVITAS